MSDQSFGKVITSTRWGDDVLRGYGVRGYNWDMSSEVQHQLNSGMSLTAGYYRNWYGSFNVTDNLAVAAGEFGTFCVKAPADPRLPGGGGYDVCGLADINPR